MLVPCRVVDESSTIVTLPGVVKVIEPKFRTSPVRPPRLMDEPEKLARPETESFRSSVFWMAPLVLMVAEAAPRMSPDIETPPGAVTDRAP